MTDQANERSSATVLALGALLLFGTMVLHPTDGMRALIEGDESNVRFGAWIHGLAILGLYLGIVGLAGVASRLGREAVLTRAGWIAWIAAAIAGSVAAAVSALTGPWLLDAFREADPERRESLALGLELMHSIPLALTTAVFGFTFLGIALWTVRMFVSRAGPLVLRGLGGLVAAAGAWSWMGDLLRPDVHSLIVFSLGVGAWQLALACWLAWGGRHADGPSSS